MSAGVLATVHSATPYVTPRLNAACFGAMSVGVFSDASLWIHPYFTTRFYAACFDAMSVRALGDPYYAIHLG